MEKILIFIKHHFKFVWKIIEWFNTLVFTVLFKSGMERILPSVFADISSVLFTFRPLHKSDAEALYELIHSQDPSDLQYFSPHEFDLKSIKKQLKISSFLMMGSFDENKMIGYFFLRFFANKKCFVGRLIDKEYRGKGIGLIMNNIMYEIAWRMGFRCLSTISRNNAAVMKAHAKNPAMKIIKELQHDYLLVEFIRNEQIN